jgi:glycosyltransferase involved in cell wall biosynthesis
VRVLLISFYHPPDIGPAPLRAQSITAALQSLGQRDLQIDVLTTRPNRYATLHSHASDVEQTAGISIRRFLLPSHRGGMVDQARAFASYARQVLKETEHRRWDVVVATSSRLMTAALAVRVAQRGGMPVYLDIRDLLTDTLGDVLRPALAIPVLPLIRAVEMWTFNRATRMNVVSPGFVSHVSRVAPGLAPTIHTNGVDDEFRPAAPPHTRRTSTPLVVYAGNIGEGQGLHRIVPAAASRIGTSAAIRIIGDGARRQHLEQQLQHVSGVSVDIRMPVPRSELLAQYQDADVLFLHLNDYRAFRKVLPSKIFEYAATGKPILAGVAGYAARFLTEQVPGAVVFEPCNAEAMVRGLEALLAGPAVYERGDFCRRYSRPEIMRSMALDIVATARSQP